MVIGKGEQSTLNIRKFDQTDGPYIGRVYRVSKVCLGECLAMQSGQLYPTITACRIGRHASAVFYHVTHIILTQRHPEFRAQQIDLERTMVISGDRRAPLVVNVAEIYGRTRAAVIERLCKEPLCGLTITISAQGVAGRRPRRR